MTPEPSLIDAMEAAEATKVRCAALVAKIEALTGTTVTVTLHVGRLSNSHIASYIDDRGWKIANHQDTAERALEALLAAVLETLTQAQAA